MGLWLSRQASYQILEYFSYEAFAEIFKYEISTNLLSINLHFLRLYYSHFRTRTLHMYNEAISRIPDPWIGLIYIVVTTKSTIFNV
jgi:hypothetical protein